jgi:hypothetical protein
MKHLNTTKLALLGALIPAALVACAAEETHQEVAEPAAPPPVVEPAPEPPPKPAAPAPMPEPVSCEGASATHTMSLARSNLVFLLDRSSTMHKSIGNDETRWTATTAGLFSILDTLPAETWGGLQMFPAGDAPRDCCVMRADNTMNCSACTVADRPAPDVRCAASTYVDYHADFAPLDPTQVEHIKTTVSADDELNYWGTPMAPALAGVIAAASSASMDGVTSVVLLTDGLPAECDGVAPDADDLSHVLDAVAVGNSFGIRTYVVGIDGYGAGGDPNFSLASNLSPIATAGGTARYTGCEASDECAYMVDVDNFDESLDEALQAVALEATACAFDMPQVSGGMADLDNTTVSLSIAAGVTSVPRDIAHQSGWDVVPGGNQVQLYGAACELLKENPDTVVEIVVACDAT